MRRLRFGLVLALPAAAAWADIVPPRPQPPPPSGPPQAGIAGHSIEPGRIDLLLAAERGATGKPLALSLQGCAGLAELELLP